jgi:NAD(P)-dependent dehydrogenase (short-subunit alcohol dehydrogenase family)
MHVLLDDKTAVIYGAGGSIGGAVARAFAREGARVFLAGRTRGKLDTVADEIRSDGGSAEADVVDALDEQAVDTYVDSVAERAGRVPGSSPARQRWRRWHHARVVRPLRPTRRASCSGRRARRSSGWR